MNNFDGSSVRITCNELKPEVIKIPRDSKNVLNEKYEGFGNHYLSANIPVSVKKPKHKASVEGTVGKITTAIIAKLIYLHKKLQD